MKKSLILLFMILPGLLFAENIQKAVFAGGCFWCMEPPFDKLNGVVSTTSGYAGGFKLNPTYKEVSGGKTGHTEVLEVIYNSDVITYNELLKVFWKNIDPSVENRQFCDAGNQYRSEIFYLNEHQKALATKSLDKLVDSNRFNTVYTKITKLKKFYPAEDYHQDYYIKNPLRYKYYRYSCGRDARLAEIWD